MEYTNKDYSDVVSVNDFQFRYNYKKMQLQWVAELTEDMKKENELYIENNAHPLYEIENNFAVIDTAPMMPGTFEDATRRNEYIEKWVDFTKEKAAAVLGIQSRDEDYYDKEA